MRTVRNWMRRNAWLRSPFVICAVILGLLYLPMMLAVSTGGWPAMTVQTMNGFELQWLSQPRDRITAVNDFQRFLSSQSCRYTLHGWSAEGKLYYGSGCWRDLWVYDPDVGEPERIRALPADFEPTTRIARWDRSETSTSTRPGQPRGTQGFVITFEKSPSPDGTMEAAVTQDHFYEALDVILIRRPSHTATRS